MSKTKKAKATPDSADHASPPVDDPTQIIETKTTAYDTIRENLEAIIVAFILALVIRHFSVEAFEIPTGSMAPTLYGIHAWMECPNCVDYKFNVGIPSNRFTGDPELGRADRTHTFVCPNCEIEFSGNLKTEGVLSGGHKILVNKMAYKIGPPRRWDIIVFQMTEDRNYIKRLLGLPGETISLRGGDLYIKKPGEDKFRVQGKTERPGVRDALWFPITNSDIQETDKDRRPAWVENHEKGSNLRRGDGKWWAWKHPSWTVNVPKGRIAVLEYNRDCRSSYNYNLLSQLPHQRKARDEEVGDKKVEFTVQPTKASSPGESWMGAEIRDGKVAFQLRIPVGKASPERKATLTRLPTQDRSDVPNLKRQPTTEMSGDRATAEVALPLLKPSHVSFWNADDRVAVEINGEEVLALDYVSGSPELRSRDHHYLRILASNVLADLKSIEVYRDIYYTHLNPKLGERHSELYVESEEADGQNRYFPCGDNSPSSSDGRAWGTVPEHNMMGRAFFIFWPAWPSNFQCGLIR